MVPKLTEAVNSYIVYPCSLEKLHIKFYIAATFGPEENTIGVLEFIKSRCWRCVLSFPFFPFHSPFPSHTLRKSEDSGGHDSLTASLDLSLIHI